MKHWWISRIASTALVIVVSILVVTSIRHRDLSPNSSDLAIPSAVSGQIVMRSFQSEGDVVPEASIPKLEPKLTERRPSSDESGQQPPRSKKVGINGNSYYWMKGVFAVPDARENATLDGYPRGFSIVNQAPKQKSVFDFNDRTLSVVQNSLGEKYIVSGSLVVVSPALSGPEIAKLSEMALVYDAGRIATYIIHAKPGQNLEAAAELLRKNPKISRVTIELIGRGARAE